jgi:hypothetical protein
MGNEIYKSLIQEQSFFGFAHLKFIIDNPETPLDSTFIEVNTSFEKITGFKLNEIIGNSFNNVFLKICDINPDLVSLCGDVARNGGEKQTELFIKPLNKWYKLVFFSNDKNYFSIILLNNNPQHDFSSIAKTFLNYTLNKVDYQYIIDKACEIAGAKYAVLNIFEPDGEQFVSVAASGINKKLLETTSNYGIKFLGMKFYINFTPLCF